MAKKIVTVGYSPIDYDNIPTGNVHETQHNRNGYPGYQHGWNGKEISNPKLFYFNGTDSPPHNKLTESKSYPEQEKTKNMKSQIKRAFSMKKDNNEKEIKVRQKQFKKTKSCDVPAIDERKLSGNVNINDTIGFYPGLESMINSYSDNFGYDGHKENLPRRYSDHAIRSQPIGYESGKGHISNSNMDLSKMPLDTGLQSKVSPNSQPTEEKKDKTPVNNGLHSSIPRESYLFPSTQNGTREPHTNLTPYMSYVSLNKEFNLKRSFSVPLHKESHKRSSEILSTHRVPVTVLDPVLPVLTHEPSFYPAPQKTSNIKQYDSSLTLKIDEHKGTPLKSAVSASPFFLPSKKVPPPVKPKPKKIPELNAIVEEEKPSISKLIDLCESILHELNTWEEITKEITDLDSQLETLISLLMGMLQRKPSMTESIASALDSFSFLTTDDDNENMMDTISLAGATSKLPQKMFIYYPTLLHHLSALYDLITGFQPSTCPLNTREQLYFHKIRQQKTVIKQMTRLISAKDNLSLQYVCEQFCEDETLANVWSNCATDTEPFYCSCTKFTEALKILYENDMNGDNHNNNENYLNISEVKGGVCTNVMKELCELDIYKTDVKVITVFQFVGFFSNETKCHNIIDYLKKSVEEFLMLKIMFCTDDLLVLSTLQQYWKIPVVKSCIQRLLSFISGEKISRKEVSLHALTKLYEIPDNKSDVLNIIIASLEESNIKIKAGACIALGKLKVQGISKKLMYLFFETETSIVKEAAQSGLKDLGHNLIRR